jgi:hypothetical protein
VFARSGGGVAGVIVDDRWLPPLARGESKGPAIHYAPNPQSSAVHDA